MFIQNTLKLFLMASCAALIAACGSGSNISNAMILQDAEASKTRALTGCDNGLQTASLAVTSASDTLIPYSQWVFN